MRLALPLLLALALAPVAHADGGRPLHGSASAGGTLLLTGDGGDHQRAELELDVEPWSHLGALVAWRGFDGTHDGLVTAGLAYEAGAARPRLVIDLHADLGLDLDQRAPVAGGGVRVLLEIIGPLGIALDSGSYLVVDGTQNTRLAITTGAAIAAIW